MSPVRRRLLKFALAGAAALGTTAISAPTWARAVGGDPREISLLNMHTGESSRVVYWADGAYQIDGLLELDHLLRDHRRDEVTEMDPRLFDLLYQLSRAAGLGQPYHVVSGYRSPATNDMLRRSGRGVARNSYHIKGQAVDFKVPGVDMRQLRKVAISMRAGGVGYYGRSSFLHMDTGRVRSW